MWINRIGNSAGTLRWVTVPPVPFPAAVVLSVALHLALAVALLLKPTQEAGNPHEAYQVRLIAAPARPEARRLDAREVPRAAESAPRTPRTDAPALAVPDVSLPGDLSTPEPEPEPQTAPQTAAPQASAPTLRERAQGQATPQAPAAPTAPRAQSPQAARAAPALPPAPPALRTPERSEPPPSAQTPPAPAPQAERPTAPTPPPPPSALESLRGIVREQEATAPQAAQTAPSAPAPSNPLSELARRRYRNGVGTRVRENHTYPADFPCGIEAVWSITIGRDGTLLASELLQSSGDARYDYAVQLTIRATEFAPIPEEVPGNSLQETLRFTPKRCTTNSSQ